MTEQKMPFIYTVLRSRRKTTAIEITKKAEVVVRGPLFMTDRMAAELVQARKAWILQHLNRQQQRLATMPPEPDEALLRQYADRARKLLPPLVEQFKTIMGVEPTHITITAARTRFGSCSGKNAISFSCRLMAYPTPAIEYVVVHELAHIRHHNHGQDFYRLVEQTLPDFRQREALLRYPPAMQNTDLLQKQKNTEDVNP